MKQRKIAIILFLLSLIVVILSRFQLGNDYFWHVKAGEYIANNGIPFTDVFSWFAIEQNLSWISHEWLFEVLIHGFKTIFNDLAPFIYTIIFTMFNFLLLFYLNRKKIKNIPFFLLWSCLGAIIISFTCLPRPHLISNIFLSLTIFLCFDLYYNKDSKKIFLLPIISLLWANFHGGSSNLVYLIPIIFIIISFVKLKLEKIENKSLTKNQLKRYLLVIGLSIIALLINPHTYQIIVYPYLNMADNTMISAIAEWQSLDIKKIEHLLIAITIFISYLVLILTKKKIRLIDLILMMLFTYLTFRSIRFCSLFYIVTTYIIFDYVDKENKLDNLTSKVIIIFSVVVMIAYINIFYQTLPKISTPIISDEMITYLQDNKPKRLYNDYNMGGYLIYHDIPVFIDGRADMYSKYNLKDSQNLILFNATVPTILDSYDFDMLIMVQGNLSTYLKEQSDYIVVMEDEKNILFEKSK